MSFETPALLGGEDVRARGPGVRFDWDVAKAICEKLACGMSERRVERLDGMPSRRAIRDWALREPVFAQWVDEAKAQARWGRQERTRVANFDRRWRQMLNPNRRGVRKSAYTPQLGEEICARIAAGESVMAIGADPTMPCAGVIHRWRNRHDEFHEMYLRAKEIGAETMFDLAYEVALETTEETVRSDRIRIQTIRWRTALLAPKVYGTRQAMGPPVMGEDEGPTQVRVIVQRWFDRPEGPQFTDLEGNEVIMPEDHKTPSAPDWYWHRHYQRAAKELATLKGERAVASGQAGLGEPVSVSVGP